MDIDIDMEIASFYRIDPLRSPLSVQWRELEPFYVSVGKCIDSTPLHAYTVIS